jgi:hypothetical protein
MPQDQVDDLTPRKADPTPMTARHLRLPAILATIVALGVALAIARSNPATAIATPVPLGTAGTYAVLAGQSVTNTGPSVITGDVGVSPGTSITGFPPGIVLGTIHSADAAALQAKSDLVTAYNNAAGQATDAVLPPDLGGLTLTPGVYTAPGAAQITGTLTLDAQNNPNAVWVFQIASTLITASASNVNLINGASPCNVYWQVGSSATLGTASTMVGTVMALTSITATTGTDIQGRLLARNGSVTLDTNTITRPDCTPTTTSSTSSTTTPGGSTSSTTSGPGGTTSSTTSGPGGSTSSTTAPGGPGAPRTPGDDGPGGPGAPRTPGDEGPGGPGSGNGPGSGSGNGNGNGSGQNANGRFGTGRHNATLPRTGTSIALTAGAGAIAIAAGGTLLIASRRRTTTDTPH